MHMVLRTYTFQNFFFSYLSILKFVIKKRDPPVLPLSRYSAPAVRGIEGVRRIEGVLNVRAFPYLLFLRHLRDLLVRRAD